MMPLDPYVLRFGALYLALLVGLVAADKAGMNPPLQLSLVMALLAAIVTGKRLMNDLGRPPDRAESHRLSAYSLVAVCFISIAVLLMSFASSSTPEEIALVFEDARLTAEAINLAQILALLVLVGVTLAVHYLVLYIGYAWFPRLNALQHAHAERGDAKGFGNSHRGDDYLG